MVKLGKGSWLYGKDDWVDVVQLYKDTKEKVVVGVNLNILLTLMLYFIALWVKLPTNRANKKRRNYTER